MLVDQQVRQAILLTRPEGRQDRIGSRDKCPLLNGQRYVSTSDKKTYVIEGEVRVRKGVKLTIRDKVTILLVNGVFSKSVVRRSALIFAQGSTLSAKRVYIKARTVQHRPVKHADNSGVWFIR